MSPSEAVCTITYNCHTQGLQRVIPKHKTQHQNAKVIISNSLAILCLHQNEARWRDCKGHKRVRSVSHTRSLCLCLSHLIPPHVNTSTTMCEPYRFLCLCLHTLHPTHVNTTTTRRYCPYQAEESSSLQEVKLDSERTAEGNFRTNQCEANLLSVFNRAKG